MPDVMISRNMNEGMKSSFQLNELERLMTLATNRRVIVDDLPSVEGDSAGKAKCDKIVPKLLCKTQCGRQMCQKPIGR